MRSLFQLLARFSGLLLFIILEGICFVLIVRFNDHQSKIWFSSAGVFAGHVNKQFDNWVDYFNLRDKISRLEKENESLLGENARLKKQILEIKLLESASQNTTLDSLTNLDSTFFFIPANLIKNEISSQKNFLTLDRGKRDGVEPHMGVIGENGLIGITRFVSNNFVSVMSLLNQDTRISAAIKRNGDHGTLTWDGRNPYHMSLITIPKHVEVQLGDTIQTSGYSEIFPEGLLIGIIDFCEIEPGGHSWTIKVELSNDLTKIQHAFIINNPNRQEIKGLEEQAQ